MQLQCLSDKSRDPLERSSMPDQDRYSGSTEKLASALLRLA
jgi:hypothetical protein